MLQELISLPVTDSTIDDTILELLLFIAEGLKLVLELLQSIQHSSDFSASEAPQSMWDYMCSLASEELESFLAAWMAGDAYDFPILFTLTTAMHNPPRDWFKDLIWLALEGTHESSGLLTFYLLIGISPTCLRVYTLFEDDPPRRIR